VSWRLSWLGGWDEVRDPAFVIQWRRLGAESAGPTGFQQPEVVSPWLTESAEPGGSSPLFGWAEHGSGARALLPWVRNSRRGRLIHRRIAEPALGSLAGYTDPLYVGDARWIPELWSRIHVELADRVEQGLFRFVHRELAPLDSNSASDASPVLELPAGATLAQLLAGTSANHRGDLGRRRRRLAERGAVDLALFTDPALAVHEFDGPFRDAYTAQWRGSASGSLLDQPGTAAFLRRLLSEQAGGWAHFSALRVEGRAVAWHLGFVFRNELYWWFPTYDPAWAGYSPGKVLLAHLVELGLASGWRCIHFLTGGHDYKLAWRPRPADLVTVRWFSPSLVGRALGAYDRLRTGR
jgi:CelD/BcsL family acetyltransferase involved in cellulose biosynthesis